MGLTCPLDLKGDLSRLLGSCAQDICDPRGRLRRIAGLRGCVPSDGERCASGNLLTEQVFARFGDMGPLGTVTSFKDETKPYRVPRYNLYPAAEIMGAAAPGVASGTAMKRMEELANQVLPNGVGYEWTELAHQQKQQGIPTLLFFGASALFVFLVLAAQYQSWKIPLAILMIIPMCLLAASTGLHLRTLPIDILAQIGFVVLLGVAAKNAILIVEFAKHHQDREGIAAEE